MLLKKTLLRVGIGMYVVHPMIIEMLQIIDMGELIMGCLKGHLIVGVD